MTDFALNGRESCLIYLIFCVFVAITAAAASYIFKISVRLWAREGSHNQVKMPLFCLLPPNINGRLWETAQSLQRMFLFLWARTILDYTHSTYLPHPKMALVSLKSDPDQIQDTEPKNLYKKCKER